MFRQQDKRILLDWEEFSQERFDCVFMLPSDSYMTDLAAFLRKREEPWPIVDFEGASEIEITMYREHLLALRALFSKSDEINQERGAGDED